MADEKESGYVQDLANGRLQQCSLWRMLHLSVTRIQ